MIMRKDGAAMCHDTTFSGCLRRAPARHCFGGFLLVVIAFAFCGCDRLMTKPETQMVKDADAKAAEGDFLRAINLYEAALTGEPASADIHYRLALLYDDKMHDPLNALHHFKRYLTLTPTGPRAAEVKNFMKRAELTLATTTSGDSMVSRTEAARLRNDNLELRKQLEDNVARTKALVATADKSTAHPDARSAKAAASKKTGEGRTYVVQKGDTLASISRRFYKSPDRWKKIQNANADTLPTPAALKPGQTLVIP
jgi:tetratricopeptide (TPR) repeat protein